MMEASAGSSSTAARTRVTETPVPKHALPHQNTYILTYSIYKTNKAINVKLKIYIKLYLNFIIKIFKS
jgi:hypothetical protein